MIDTGRPMAFLAVDDFVTARAFYEDVIGLCFVSEDSFALVLQSGPILLRLTQPPQRVAAGYTVFGWRVDDIAASVGALAAKGVRFERYGFLGEAQSADGIWTAPGGDKVAWFQDPSGNLLSLSQHVT